MSNELAVITCAGLFAFILIPVIWLSAREWSVLYTLDRIGVDTRAQIDELQKDIQRQRVTTVTYYVIYHFFVDDVRYANKQQITAEHYSQLQDVKELSIKYLPSRLSVSRLAGRDVDNKFRNLLSTVAFPTMILVPPLIVLWLAVFAFTHMQMTHER